MLLISLYICTYICTAVFMVHNMYRDAVFLHIGILYMVHGDAQTTPVTEITTLGTTGPVPADSRQGTPSVRSCVTR